MSVMNHDLLLRLFPGLEGTARELLGNAADSGLDPLDLYTLRDLRELSGCDDQDLPALLGCLFLALREGSVCLDVSAAALEHSIRDLVPAEAQAPYAARLAALPRDPRFLALIATDPSDNKPVLVQQRGERQLLYFHKYLHAELALQQLLDERMRLAPVLADTAVLRGVLQDVMDTSGLNAQQQVAVALALVRDFVVVSGGPGTGKTSIVAAILRGLLRAGVSVERMAVACPTGRAAQRLTEALRGGLGKLTGATAAQDQPLWTLEARTMHRLLGFRPGSGHFTHHRDHPLPYDVVLVDETSMLDVVLMARLLEATAKGTKLILLGDKDQLPSVDAGSVLADLVPDGKANAYSPPLAALLTGILQQDVAAHTNASDYAVLLQKNYRSQQHIQSVAEAVRAMPADAQLAAAQAIVAAMPRTKIQSEFLPLDSFQHAAGESGGVWLAEQTEHKHWLLLLESWALSRFGADYWELAEATPAPAEADVPAATAQLDALFKTVNSARILTVLRDGFYGSAGVNDAALRALRRAHELPPDTQRFAGLPIIISSNDYLLQLFNGDVGLLLRNADGALRAVFERSSGGQRHYASFPLEAVPAHDPAFAITVHKAQGSEYREVLVVLPPDGARRLLNRQTIYTAIMRAQKLAVVSAKADVLAAALHRSVARTSGLVLLATQPTAQNAPTVKAPPKARRKRAEDKGQSSLFD